MILVPINKKVLLDLCNKKLEQILNNRNRLLQEKINKLRSTWWRLLLLEIFNYWLTDDKAIRILKNDCKLFSTYDEIQCKYYNAESYCKLIINKFKYLPDIIEIELNDLSKLED